MIRNETIRVCNDTEVNIGLPKNNIPSNIKALTETYKQDFKLNAKIGMESINEVPVSEHDSLQDIEVNKLALHLYAIRQKWRTEGLAIASDIIETAENIINNQAELKEPALDMVFIPEIFFGPTVSNLVTSVTLYVSDDELSDLRNRIKFYSPDIDSIQRRVVSSGLFTPEEMIELLTDITDENLVRIYNSFYGNTSVEDNVDWYKFDDKANFIETIRPTTINEVLIAYALSLWHRENIAEGTGVSLDEYNQYLYGIGSNMQLVLEKISNLYDYWDEYDIVVQNINRDEGIIGTVIVNVFQRLRDDGVIPENSADLIIDLITVPSTTMVNATSLNSPEQLATAAEYRQDRNDSFEKKMAITNAQAALSAIDVFCRANNIDFNALEGDFANTATENIYDTILRFLSMVVYKNSYVKVYIKAMSEISNRVEGLTASEIEGRALIYLAAFIVSYSGQQEADANN